MENWGPAKLGVGAGPSLGWVPRGPLPGSALLACPRRARCLGPSPLSSLLLAPRADPAEAWRPSSEAAALRGELLRPSRWVSEGAGHARGLATVAKDDPEETLAVPLPQPQSPCMVCWVQSYPDLTPTSSSCQEASEPGQPVPRAGEVCGSALQRAAPHGAPSQGQAEVWLLSESPRREAEGESSCAAGGWALPCREATGRGVRVTESQREWGRQGARHRAGETERGGRGEGRETPKQTFV